MLIPLAITSTNRMMKRLGRRWSQLHRLIYLIVLLGVVHFWWLKQDKNDLSEPLIFSGIIAVLLLFRLLYPFWQRLAKGAAAKKVARDEGCIHEGCIHEGGAHEGVRLGPGLLFGAAGIRRCPGQSASRRSPASSVAIVSRSRTTSAWPRSSSTSAARGREL